MHLTNEIKIHCSTKTKIQQIAKLNILPHKSAESSVDIFLSHHQHLLLPWPH
jgi:hypothetical protein